MPTNVVMPQMGESIAEGTIVRWMKEIGDAVERDEPLFEISTDKVDAEVPSPAAGVLTEIKAREGETVPVNSVVAVIGAAETAEAAQPDRDRAPVAAHEQADGSVGADGPPAEEAPPQIPEPSERPAPAASLPRKSSPLVRKIAREHNIDLAEVPGTGLGGRVTKDDILGVLEARKAPEPAPPPPRPAPVDGTISPTARVEIQPMSVMRKTIAERMIASRRTSAHVHSVFEINFARVAAIRAQRQAEYEAAGTSLTYLVFIAKAVVDALRAAPIINSSLEGGNILIKKDINLGIAVALDWGLIVPVVKHANEKNMLGLARAIGDLAARARSKQLKPDEVQDGTFTITNPGVFGAAFGMPIINQPQVAILGVGAIEKRPVVIDDALAIRPMAFLTLGYDHRLIDGAVADQFMGAVKRRLENFDASDL